MSAGYGLCGRCGIEDEREYSSDLSARFCLDCSLASAEIDSMFAHAKIKQIERKIKSRLLGKVRDTFLHTEMTSLLERSSETDVKVEFAKQGDIFYCWIHREDSVSIGTSDDSLFHAWFGARKNHEEFFLGGDTDD